jgi:hypothetical protein
METNLAICKRALERGHWEQWDCCSPKQSAACALAGLCDFVTSRLLYRNQCVHGRSLWLSLNGGSPGIYFMGVFLFCDLVGILMDVAV